LLAFQFLPGAPHQQMVVQKDTALELQEDVLAFAEDPLDPLASERFGRDVITVRLATKHLAARKVLL
jgi:hypothetical protein